MYHIARNFRGRKLSRILQFCGYSCEIWGRGVLWCSKTKQSTKVFSAKIIYFTNSRKFSPLKVSRYTVYAELKATVCYIWISAHVSETTTLRINTTTSTNHTKHTNRHSISNVCQIIPNNFRVYNSH